MNQRLDRLYAMSTLDHDRRNKKPRMLSESERERLDEFIDSIHYSSRLEMFLSSAAPNSETETLGTDYHM